MRHSQLVRALFGAVLLVMAISCGANQPVENGLEVGVTTQAATRADDPLFTPALIRAGAKCPSCVVQHVARLHLPETGVIAASAKLSGPGGTFPEVTIDGSGALVEPAELFRAERAAAKAKYGKLRPDLFAWTQSAQPDDVAWIWIRTKVTVDFGRREAADTPAAAAVTASIEEALAAANAPIQAWLAANAPDAAIGASAGPVLRARLTAAQVHDLEALETVVALGTDEYPGKPQGSPWSSISQWGVSIRLPDALALTTGSGTVVCVKEDARPDSYTYLTVAGTAGSTGSTTQHARVSAGLLRNTDSSSFLGIIPSGSVYIANFSGYANVDSYCQTAGANAISYSYNVNGTTSGSAGAIDMQHDWLTKVSPYPLVVAAAGTIDVSTDSYVKNRGFSGLVVGGVDDHGTGDRSDDVWDVASAWQNPTTAHNDYELPHVVAPSNGVDVAAGSGSGTSTSTTMVAGLSSLLISRSSDLRSWPEGQRAVILATATGRADQGSVTSLPSGDMKIGAGEIDAYQAVDLANYSNLPTADTGSAVNGRATGMMTFSSDFDASNNWIHKYKVHVTQNGRLRVALAWDSSASCTNADSDACTSDTQDADLDLLVYPSDASSWTLGTWTCWSSTYDSTWELCDIPVTAGQYYIINPRHYATNASSTYYGLAWYQYQQPSGSSCSSGGECASGTCSSGKCTCTNDAQCPDRLCGTGGQCANRYSTGIGCSSNTQCASGYCVDGYCCGSSCTDTCGACDVAGHLGSCFPISGTPHGSRGSCSDGNACNGVESCEGATTACAAGVPLETTDYDDCTTDTCDPPTGTITHTPITTGECAPATTAPGAVGGSCRSNADCATGHCTDGVCCDSACTGQCESCGLPDHAGTCTAVSGAPVGRPACGNDGTSCGGSCDGTNRSTCTYPSATTACGTATCGASLACDGAGHCSPSPACSSCPTTLSASAIDTTIAADFPSSTAFIYSGTGAVQTGLTAGTGLNGTTLVADRVSVIKGTITTRDGSPVYCATVTAPDNPAFGQTTTLPNGSFYLAVNGGTTVRIRVSMPGYIAGERTVVALAHEYVDIDDLALVPQEMSQAVALGASTSQVILGSQTIDDRTARRGVLYVPPGTTASLKMPDGSSVAQTQLHVAITEMTVGENGPKAMPANLPTMSAYTYAMELSADEVASAGAVGVTFDSSHPLVYYVDNFLGFPRGATVPYGYYDRTLGAWIPAETGRIIELESVTSGKADVSVDGDNVPDTGAAPTALGITDDERTSLAALYSGGGLPKTIWRVRVFHFSPQDLNYAIGCPSPDGCPYPTVNSPQQQSTDDPCDVAGSIIECQNRAFREVLAIPGTDFSLTYDSANHSAHADTLRIPLTGLSIPTGLSTVVLGVEIGGRKYEAALTAAAELTYSLHWWPYDPFGRPLVGAQKAHIRVGYTYANDYKDTSGFGAPGDNQSLSSTPTATTVWTSRDVLTEAWSDDGMGFGGWRLDAQHAYDPSFDVLHTGDGETRAAGAAPPGLYDFVGTCSSSPTPQTVWAGGEPEPAISAHLWNLYTPDYGALNMVFGADGDFYFTDGNGVRRVQMDTPNKVLDTVAGNGNRDCGPTLASCGFGGSPLSATLGFASGLVVAKDSSFIVGSAEETLFAQFSVGGTASVYSGTLHDGEQEDSFSQPLAMVRDPDGTLYAAMGPGNVIRRIAPDGTVAIWGTGLAGFGGEGKPVTDSSVQFATPGGIARAPDGTLYIADTGNGRIRKIDKTGVITTVAGGIENPNNGLGTEIDPLTAGLQNPQQVQVGIDGTVFFTDTKHQCIRAIGLDGLLHNVVGFCTISSSDPWTTGADRQGIGATDARLYWPAALMIAPNGDLYIQDMGHGCIRRAAHVGATADDAGEVLVAASGGNEVYAFSATGKHLRTVDALTNTTRYTFAYDASGLLSSITDADGNVTQFNRSGNTITVVGPFGTHTTLTLSGGALTAVTNANSETVTLGYGASPSTQSLGLLTSLTDPKGQVHYFEYNGFGELTSDRSPSGRTKTIDEFDDAGDWGTVLTTAMGRQDEYGVTLGTDGSVTHVHQSPAADLSTQTTVDSSGKSKTTTPDGTVVQATQVNDGSFGSAAPFANGVTITLPSSLTYSASASQNIVGTGVDPANLTSITDTVTVNGATYTSSYNRASKTLQLTVPGLSGGTTTVATMTHDAKGHLSSVQYPGLPLISYAYDSNGRVVLAAEGADPDCGDPTKATPPYCRRVATAYRTDGFVDTVTDPLGGVLQLTPDPVGRPLETAFSAGATSFGSIDASYDLNGNIVSLTPPGKGIHGFTLDSDDDVSAYVPPDTTWSVHSYRNHDGQLTYVDVPDLGVVHFVYEDDVGSPTGRLHQVLFGDDGIEYAYDSAGRVGEIEGPGSSDIVPTYDGSVLTDMSVSGPVQGSLHWRYRSGDLRLSSFFIDAEAAVTYAYETNGLLKTVDASALVSGATLDVTRDATTLRVTGTAVGSVTDTYGVDAFGALSSYVAKYGSSTLFEISDVSRDNAGRLTDKKETVDGTTHTYHYDYTLDNRLWKATKDGQVVEYAYDLNGNRTSKTRVGYYTSNYGVATASDLILHDDDWDYQYFAFGSLQTRISDDDEPYDFTYDGLAHLASSQNTSGDHVDYIYDGLGRRVLETTNGVFTRGFLYDGNRIVASVDASGTVLAQYVYGPGSGLAPALVIKGGHAYRLITDERGSVRLLVDVATGTIENEIEYDEYGAVVSIAGAYSGWLAPFGYIGGVLDTNGYLWHLGQRDYDPSTGRWIERDPSLFGGGDTNLYAYAGGDPINFVDPTGLDAMDSALNGFLSYIPGVTAFAQGVHNFADGRLMMGSDATAALGEKKALRGACQMGLGASITAMMGEGAVQVAQLAIGSAKGAIAGGGEVAESEAEAGSGASQKPRTTVIGRMKDLEQFEDDPDVDTWWKSGRLPSQDGGGPVTWKENAEWLQERIDRGDNFGIATDPEKLGTSYIANEPNGYFTWRELQYLLARGIEPLPYFR